MSREWWIYRQAASSSRLGVETSCHSMYPLTRDEVMQVMDATSYKGGYWLLPIMSSLEIHGRIARSRDNLMRD